MTTTKQGIDLLEISETVLLFLSLVLLIAAGIYRPLLWVGLGTMAFLWLVRWLSQGYLTPRTPLDVPILLFLLSALVGLWPSYDQALSLSLFLTIGGGIVLSHGHGIRRNHARFGRPSGGLSRLQQRRIAEFDPHCRYDIAAGWGSRLL